MKIYPSLLAAPVFEIYSAVQDLDPSVPGYHIDIMDNHFVPNIGFNLDFVHALDKITSKPLWLHLMVTDPLSLIERLKVSRPCLISIHIEAPCNHTYVLHEIKTQGHIPSLALNPQTQVDLVYPFGRSVNNVLIMGVNPGFSGQEFIPETIDKLSTLSNWKYQNNFDCSLAVDGGVKPHHFKDLVLAGAHMCVAGSALFNHAPFGPTYCNFIEKLRRS